VLLHSKSLETIRKLTRVGRLNLPGVFTREKVNESSVTQHVLCRYRILRGHRACVGIEVYILS